ncbi:MAG: hypothetical protein GY715_16850 [Planctomycetes bacterium]|nr:hypothetical protein [Planctomycetota bacterium]
MSMTRFLLLPAALLASFATAPASAGDPQTWMVDQSTSGEDIVWTSPTAVRPDAAYYGSELTITQVFSTVLFFGLPIEVDVTDQVPPELLFQVDCAPGPAPVELFNDVILFPDPPEPVAIAADLLTGIDATGFAFFSATNVVLGEADVGFGTVQILGLRLVATITMEAFGVATCPADIDEDGFVGFSDILAVIGQWGPCECCRADLDGNLNVGFSDILAIIGAWGACP